MLTLRKFASLADGTRRRKGVMLLREFERLLISGKDVDFVYLSGLMTQIGGDESWPADIRRRAAEYPFTSSLYDQTRILNSMRHQMLKVLGRDWADWDVETPGDEADNAFASPFPIRVYADGLRSPFNVGSLMRTSMAFAAEQIWFSPDGASPEHRRARRSAMGAVDKLKWDIRPLNELNKMETGTIFALELGGIDISDFSFPESGTVIIGSEELGVSPEALHLAEDDGGVVTIPLPGGKASLNAGVAFGILLRQWVEALN